MPEFATGIDFATLFKNRSGSAREETVANICESMVTPDRTIAGNAHKQPTRISMLALYRGIETAMRLDPDLTEAIATTTFQSINRTQVVDEVLQGYAEVARVGRDLVTMSNQPGKKSGTMARATTSGTLTAIKEGEEYPQIGLSDKNVTFKPTKYAGQIPLTVETVMEDQTGTVLDEARNVGREGGAIEEKTILNTIMDLAGFQGYRPAGVTTTLYVDGGDESQTQTPTNNIKTSNALENWTDIDAARVLLGTKVKENGEPIATPVNLALLAPIALQGAGGYIVQNTKDTRANRGANAPREVLNLPGGNFYSPYLDAQSVSTWFLGDFKRQFTQVIYWALKAFFVQGTTNSEMALRDIWGAYAASIFFDVIARDFRFVIKNTA